MTQIRLASARCLPLLLLGLFLSFENAGAAFACDERKVSVGQTMGEVKARCGEPTWKERRKAKVILKGPSFKRSRGAQTVEEWGYNLGPQEFVRILQFENGTLARIETGEYGWTPNAPADFGCEHTTLRNGASKVEVKERCGKPTSISKQKRRANEAWRYDLGPGRLVRIYRFENGRLVETKTGGYGK